MFFLAVIYLQSYLTIQISSLLSFILFFTKQSQQYTKTTKVLCVYNRVFKKNEGLRSFKLWMNFEDIMLSRINQLQKDSYCFFSYVVPGVRLRYMEIESRLVGCRMMN